MEQKRQQLGEPRARGPMAREEKWKKSLGQLKLRKKLAKRASRKENAKMWMVEHKLSVVWVLENWVRMCSEDKRLCAWVCTEEK